MRRTTPGSSPYGREPRRASPDSFRRTRRNFGLPDTCTPSRGGLRGRIGCGAGDGLPEHVAHEPSDADVLPGLGDDPVDDVAHGHVRIADERLLQETELLVVLLHLAGDDLLDHRVRLAGRLGLLPVNL